MPAHLIPAGADAHGIGGSIFKQGVGPGDEVDCRIGGGVDGVAAGGGDDADVLGPVDKTCSGEEHAEDGSLAATHAGASAADIEKRVGAEHHVDE